MAEQERALTVYELFKRHRLIKLLGLLVGLVLLSYLIYGFSSLYSSRSLGVESWIGFYAHGSTHQVILFKNGLGHLVSDEASFGFRYSYDYGSFHCEGEDGQSWEMKGVSKTNLYSLYDHTFLYRQEDNS